MQGQRKEATGQEDRIVDGFSSEEEVQHEEIQVQQVRAEEREAGHREQVRFKIPPPPQIKDKSYSLRPDLETGYCCNE